MNHHVAVNSPCLTINQHGNNDSSAIINHPEPSSTVQLSSTILCHSSTILNRSLFSLGSPELPSGRFFTSSTWGPVWTSRSVWQTSGHPSRRVPATIGGAGEVILCWWLFDGQLISLLIKIELLVNDRAPDFFIDQGAVCRVRPE